MSLLDWTARELSETLDEIQPLTTSESSREVPTSSVPAKINPTAVYQNKRENNFETLKGQPHRHEFLQR